MARKFTRNPINSPGIYEVHLFDPMDNEIEEAITINVYMDYETGILLLDEGETLCNLESLYEEHGVEHRKVKQLPNPFTFDSDEAIKGYKKNSKRVELDEDQQEILKYHVGLWQEEYDNYNQGKE